VAELKELTEKLVKLRQFITSSSIFRETPCRWASAIENARVSHVHVLASARRSDRELSQGAGL